ncbi:hypothetical protein BDB01DRAFT_791254 [Pilobolus umbonatus]|nr:hypothetical protein BDB01DRAFT_791254 [Pilobolus umbonatus]
MEQKNRNVLKSPIKANVAAKRLCRNVIIHGYCKYEGKGCEFNHDNNKFSPQTSPGTNKRGQLPLFSTVSSVPADSVNAPEFVPRSINDTSTMSPMKGKS